MTRKMSDSLTSMDWLQKLNADYAARHSRNLAGPQSLSAAVKTEAKLPPEEIESKIA